MIFNLKKIIIYSSLIVLFSFNVLAESKIVYVNMDLVLSNINVGKKMFEKLSLNENKKKKNLTFKKRI